MCIALAGCTYILYFVNITISFVLYSCKSGIVGWNEIYVFIHDFNMNFFFYE